jgi:hypothetical protein
MALRVVEQGASGPQVVLAIGSGLGRKLVLMIFTCIGANLGGSLVGGLVFLIMYLLRQRTQKRLGIT